MIVLGEQMLHRSGTIVTSELERQRARRYQLPKASRF